MRRVLAVAAPAAVLAGVVVSLVGPARTVESIPVPPLNGATLLLIAVVGCGGWRLSRIPDRPPGCDFQPKAKRVQRGPLSDLWVDEGVWTARQERYREDVTQL